ncbi:hypothetical protein D018_2016B, partial [Vibrio parahaemolyticus VP2007-007]
LERDLSSLLLQRLLGCCRQIALGLRLALLRRQLE